MSDKPTRSGGGSGLATLPEWAGEFREWTFDLDYLHRDRKAALARMEALVEYAQHKPGCRIDAVGLACGKCTCGLSELLAACERRE